MAEEPASSAPAPSQATIDRLVQAVERAYHRPWRMMGRSFLHGFMTALGATVGTAVFFAVLIWVFQQLGGLELLRPGVEKLQDLLIPDEFQQLEGEQAQQGFLQDDGTFLLEVPASTL